MTVILSYSCNDYSIIATDTRASSGKSGPFNDNAQKLQSTSYGWITGMGSILLASQLKEEIDKGTVNSISDLESAFIDVHHQILRFFGDTNDNRLNNSYVILTWSKFILQLRYKTEPVLSTECNRIRDNWIHILYPPEFISDKTKYDQFASEFDFEFWGTLNACILQILKMFKAISLCSDYVSDICDIGILSNGVIYQIRENIDVLILGCSEL